MSNHYLMPTVGAGLLNEAEDDRKKRGYNVYSSASMVGVDGVTKNGNYLQMFTDDPFFTLTVDERFDIFKKSSIIFGIVTSRMNRISATDWEILPEKKVEDRIADQMKFSRDIYKELKNSTELSHLLTKSKIVINLRERLPDLLPDMSNFENALLRWKKVIQYINMDKSDEIEDWLWKPNPQEDWVDFSKKWVQDLMVHGADAIYASSDNSNDLKDLFHLPGGSVLPLKEKYVGSLVAYVQILDNLRGQIYFGDEMIWTPYHPTSARAYPMVPLEALVTKIAESLLFDKKMANEADGTKTPEKLIVFGEKTGMSGLDDTDVMGMDKSKQKRIETKMNEVKKEAIMTLTGVGTPIAVDLSKRDTMATQLDRQKMVREEAAIVYNMSNMEVNLTGSGDTSGRSTSEEQGNIDRSKGYWPIAFLLQNKTTRQIIRRKFGPGYVFAYKEGQDEMAELQKLKLKKDSGLLSVNEIRGEDMNRVPFEGEQFNTPSEVGVGGVPGESNQNPLFVNNGQ